MVSAEPLADVVQQCCGPQLSVIGVSLRVLKHLQGVKQGIPFRVPNRVLLDAIDGLEEVTQLLADIGR